MDESIIRSCILFLTLVAPTSQKIFPAAEQVVESSRRKKARHAERSTRSFMIEQSNQFLKESRWQRVPAFSSRENAPTIPGLELDRLKKLRSEIKPGEFEAFLWLECVNVPIEDAAVGLGTSEGTLRYRAHRALKAWTELG